MAIQVKRGVEFKLIPAEMLPMFTALIQAGEAQGIEAVITGAAYNGYPPGKVHDAGYAIDVRTSNIPDPQHFADSVDRYLRIVNPHYKVIYGEPDHLDHIHIGFAWWYSRRETRRRVQHGITKLGMGDQPVADRIATASECGYTVDQGSVRGQSAQSVGSRAGNGESD